MRQTITRLSRTLFAPIDIAPLVFFRVAFGALMLWEVWRYFHYDRIARYYVDPTFNFHYFGFHWLQPLPGDGMLWLFHGLGVLSVLIMLGAAYRLSMTVFWLAFTYVFLLDNAQYLNHFYLVSLVSFLMIFVPAHRALSVDAWLRPSLRTGSAPAWSLGLLRAQMAVVYIFGGFAKINPDWLAGEPLREWLGRRTDFPLIGPLFTEEWMVYLFSYGGLLLDLLVVPLLLWRRTRWFALVLALGFHLANARLFNIGIFPWFAIAATLLFLPPRWFRPWRWFRPAAPTPSPTPSAAPPVMPARRAWLLAGIAVYFVVQLWLPVRHWLYPGDPSWTEEGHTLAWRMRLRDKDGTIAFYASDPTTGLHRRIPVEGYLSARQFDQMKDNPPMILRFVHELTAMMQPAYPDIEIRVWTMLSLNSRPPQMLIDPTADLAQAPDDLLAADWILPLTQPVAHQPPVPTLLISRRLPDALVLLNITQTTYPLAGLTLHTDAAQLDPTTFDVSDLLPGECLIAHTASADTQAIFAPCNETGARQVIDEALLTAPLGVMAADGAVQACDGVRCLVTAAS